MLPRGMHFALVYCQISEGMGRVNNVNSDSGFPGGRGDTKSAVIRGRVWIFLELANGKSVLEMQNYFSNCYFCAFCTTKATFSVH